MELGPTIRRGAGLRAAATPSGSSSPSPGRAGRLRRRGRIQNHRSESNIGVRNVFFQMTMIFMTIRARGQDFGGARSVSRARDTGPRLFSEKLSGSSRLLVVLLLLAVVAVVPA